MDGSYGPFAAYGRVDSIQSLAAGAKATPDSGGNGHPDIRN
jgi:hypothetical protein